jgi:uncharacterized protein YdeI (BOF family)
MSDFTFKRGSSFSATVTYTPAAGGLANLIGATITSSIKDANGVTDDLAVSLNGAGLVITTTRDELYTADWHTGEARWDIRVSISGTVFYSETIEFLIIPEITKA